MQVLTNWMNSVGGNSEMVRLVRDKDWSATPLGPIEQWPQSLRTTVGLCLASNFPINIIWGAARTQIYNDGYRILCGEKHPAFLGMDYALSWASAWPAIGEPFARGLAGESSFLENQRMFLHRNGYLEETFFTFSTSPIRDESGGIGGLFHPVTETTAAMLSERRTRAVRDLTAHLVKARTTQEVFALTAEMLAEFPFDMPFMLLYGLDQPGSPSPRYQLAACIGLDAGSGPAPALLELDTATPWPVASVIETRLPEMVGDLAGLLDTTRCGPYEELPDAAYAVPLNLPGSKLPAVIMIAGASARLPLDDSYRDFYGLIGAAISAALAHARSYEDRRRQAEALSAIDRARTTFFSNVSHEFRTPLALMLGPLEEALEGGVGLAAAQRERLQIAHRNAQRLLKLVNSLLDFSRIEAGRSEIRFEPVELAGFTAELASSFRSACELAGLKLVVKCPALDGPVDVDRDMWEKIVLNLISNAFKFTLTGHIAVSLSANGSDIELVVGDTGIGIPAHELSRVFERFHRIEGRPGRSHEGSGIGLALVEDLIKLHGGTVGVTSILGQGSEFRVTLPRTSPHPAAEGIGHDQESPATALRTRAHVYAEEAIRWLPEQAGPDRSPAAGIGDIIPAPNRPRIVLAEDNADMRAYVGRILARAGYEVEAVGDGAEALAASRRERMPDLILADVMMPVLDGFGLLREIRSNAATEGIVVILLSARAGEEARVEGLAAGADDYIVKPFNARELRARIDGAITLARQRREAEARERHLRAEISAERNRVVLSESERRLEFALEAGRLGSWELDLATRCFTGSAVCVENLGLGAANPSNLYEALLAQIHPDDRDRQRDALAHAVGTGAALDIEHRMVGPDGRVTWVEVCGHVVRAEDGAPLRMVGVCLDVTTRKHAEQRQALLLDELNHRVKNTLSIVQSIAMQTHRNARSPASFIDDLLSRIASLAGAHDLLTQASWEGALLGDVIGQTLAHIADMAGDGRIAMHGPALKLSPSTAVTLNMAFHELATNAAKYGALSVPDGRVRVEWQIDPAPGPGMVDLVWQETDGPAVEAPDRRGFGSRLIERGLAVELGGEVRLDFAPRGVRCHMRLPLSSKILPVVH